MSQVNAFLDGLKYFAVIMHIWPGAVTSDNEESQVNIIVYTKHQ